MSNSLFPSNFCAQRLDRTWLRSPKPMTTDYWEALAWYSPSKPQMNCPTLPCYVTFCSPLALNQLALMFTSTILVDGTKYFRSKDSLCFYNPWGMSDRRPPKGLKDVLPHQSELMIRVETAPQKWGRRQGLCCGGICRGVWEREREQRRERGKATVLKSSWLPPWECNPYVSASSAAGERKDITRKEAIVSAFLV